MKRQGNDKRMLADGYRCAINTTAARCYIILDSHTRNSIRRSSGHRTGLGTCAPTPSYRPVGGGPKCGQGTSRGPWMNYRFDLPVISCVDLWGWLHKPPSTITSHSSHCMWSWLEMHLKAVAMQNKWCHESHQWQVSGGQEWEGGWNFWKKIITFDAVDFVLRA